MKTKIVYSLIASKNDLFLEECWVSIYSLRIFHPEASVVLLVDEPTKQYIDKFPDFCHMVTEIIIVPVPDKYNAKQKSRELKTKTRLYVDGSMLFLDNDTVICKSLDKLDDLSCDIAAVPETHLPLQKMPFSPLSSVKSVFGTDASDSKYYFNSGVIYASDNAETRDFFKKWNENWKYSCFEKGNSQDEPSFLMANREFDNMIEELPGIYNAQVQMSLKYFADAAIIHWWHMNFIEDQSYSPYFSQYIYRELKRQGKITPAIDELIRNCKQTFVSPSMPVGIDQMYFLFSPVGKIFSKIYKDGGIASALMLRAASLLEKIHKISRHK